MKKHLSFTIVLFVHFWGFSQLNQEFVGKTFTGKIGFGCEETSAPNACAGYQIFLEFKFKKYNVEIIEKNISSCGKVSVGERLVTSWFFEKPNKIVLTEMKRKFSGTKILEGNVLIYNNSILYGKPARADEDDFEFIEELN